MKGYVMYNVCVVIESYLKKSFEVIVTFYTIEECKYYLTDCYDDPNDPNKYIILSDEQLEFEKSKGHKIIR